MKCVNCRCIIPESSDHCIYCGQKVYRGSTVTMPVVYRRPAYRPSDAYRQPASYAPEYRYDAYTDRYGDSYRADAYQSAQQNYPDASYINPSYYGPYGYSGELRRGDHPFEQPNYQENKTEWDFSVINNDGSIDMVKLLLYFAGLDMLLVLLLLLIALADLL